MYERIKEYKKLLDEGVITQEEFDEEKAKLLGFETPRESAARKAAERKEAEQLRQQQERVAKEALARKALEEERMAEIERKRKEVAAAEEAKRLGKKEEALAKKEGKELKKKQKKERRAEKRSAIKSAIKRKKKVIAGGVVGLCALLIAGGAISYAVSPERAFAVYSDDDHSLTFYRGKPPIQGLPYEGKACTTVYDNRISPSTNRTSTATKTCQDGRRAATPRRSNRLFSPTWWLPRIAVAGSTICLPWKSLIWRNSTLQIQSISFALFLLAPL